MIVLHKIATETSPEYLDAVLYTDATHFAGGCTFLCAQYNASCGGTSFEPFRFLFFLPDRIIILKQASGKNFSRRVRNLWTLSLKGAGFYVGCLAHSHLPCAMMYDLKDIYIFASVMSTYVDVFVGPRLAERLWLIAH